MQGSDVWTMNNAACQCKSCFSVLQGSHGIRVQGQGDKVLLHGKAFTTTLLKSIV